MEASSRSLDPCPAPTAGPNRAGAKPQWLWTRTEPERSLSGSGPEPLRAREGKTPEATVRRGAAVGGFRGGTRTETLVLSPGWLLQRPKLDAAPREGCCRWSAAPPSGPQRGLTSTEAWLLQSLPLSASRLRLLGNTAGVDGKNSRGRSLGHVIKKARVGLHYGARSSGTGTGPVRLPSSRWSVTGLLSLQYGG